MYNIKLYIRNSFLKKTCLLYIEIDQLATDEYLEVITFRLSRFKYFYIIKF